MEHLINHTKPSKEDKVLLILDGYKSHTHNIKALERASENGVILLSLPPHTSHHMQPLNLTFFKPLKTYYSQHISQWMCAHPGRAVTLCQISQLFGLAYEKSANVSCAVNGFRKAGIFPLNPLVFDESDFEPSEVTDRPAPAKDCSTIDNAPEEAPVCSTDTRNSSVIQPPLLASKYHGSAKSAQVSVPDAQPTSEALSISGKEQSLDDSSSANLNLASGTGAQEVSVLEISPLPKRIYTINSKRRKSSKTTVLTSSPHKRSMKASERRS